MGTFASFCDAALAFWMGGSFCSHWQACKTGGDVVDVMGEGEYYLPIVHVSWVEVMSANIAWSLAVNICIHTCLSMECSFVSKEQQFVMFLKLSKWLWH